MRDDDPDLNDDIGEPEGAAPRKTHVGRYRLLNPLGSGGMASVYLARLQGEGGFERLVAVKQIHEHMVKEPKFRNMFLDEARIAAKLQHPNVVQVTDFGVEENVPYLVMEFVDGENLASVLRACWKRAKTLTIPIAVRIVAWACEGLHHAHELRDADGHPLDVVHRDVSPHNILISYDGVVKVADFGIAKAVDRVSNTRSGSLKGKITYMSPEQVLAQTIDRRSDIFSLGIILFETTLGRRLFRADSEFETLQRIISAQVPYPTSIDPGFPPALEKVILRALQSHPEKRYPSARDMQRDLEQILVESGKPVGTAEIGELMTSLFKERMESRNRVLATVLTTSPTGDLQPLYAHDSTGDTLPSPRLLALRASARKKRSRVPWLATAGAVGLLVAGTTIGWMMATTGAGPAETPVAAAPEPDRDRPNPGGSPGVTEPGEDGGGARPGVGDPTVPDGAAIGDRTLSDDAEPEPGTDAAPDAGTTPAGTHAGGNAGNGTDRPRQPPRRRDADAPQGRVSIIADPWCEVFVGNRRLGRTPLAGVPLPAGRQVILLFPRGERPAVRRVVTIRPGETVPISVDLAH